MIRARGLTYDIGGFALNVSLDVGDGEYFVLLGATGSGKTLFLECLAGLRAVRSGSIEIGGRDVTDADPRSRRVGYVPQDGALFPHLGVAANIAFGLRARRCEKNHIEERVREVAGMLRIEHLLGRRIAGLSGGERQRVALARALACEPDALLLDEPVSALDEFTRDAVCREIMRLQRRTGVSVIHVCHSFDEALLVADRIGVIGAGQIVQTGTPDELMQSPRNRYIANILRLENVFTGTADPEPGGSLLRVNGLTLHGPHAAGQIEIIIRPWDIRLRLGDAEPAANVCEGRIVEFRLAGSLAKMLIDGPLPLAVQLPRNDALAAHLAEGESVRLAFDREAIHVLGGK